MSSPIGIPRFLRLDLIQEKKVKEMWIYLDNLKQFQHFRGESILKMFFLESFFYACPLFVAFWIEATISSILDFISSTLPSGMLVLICSTILL